MAELTVEQCCVRYEGVLFARREWHSWLEVRWYMRGIGLKPCDRSLAYGPPPPTSGALTTPPGPDVASEP